MMHIFTMLIILHFRVAETNYNFQKLRMNFCYILLTLNFKDLKKAKFSFIYLYFKTFKVRIN